MQFAGLFWALKLFPQVVALQLGSVAHLEEAVAHRGLVQDEHFWVIEGVRMGEGRVSPWVAQMVSAQDSLPAKFCGRKKFLSRAIGLNIHQQSRGT
jgi:hypothetical protein